MEPLWSPVVATGGNQWQIGSAPKPPQQAETAAVGCDRLPIGDGKESDEGGPPAERNSARPRKTKGGPSHVVRGIGPEPQASRLAGARPAGRADRDRFRCARSGRAREARATTGRCSGARGDRVDERRAL